MWFFKVYVHGCDFYLFKKKRKKKREKPYFEGWETLKKNVIALLSFKNFKRFPILDKDKTFVLRVM